MDRWAWIAASGRALPIAGLLLALLVAGPSAAAENEDPAAPQATDSEAAPEPESIPLPEIVERAESVRARLRSLEAEPDPRDEFDDIEAALPALARSVATSSRATEALLAADPTLDTLRNLEAEWGTLAADLPAWEARLSDQGTALAEQLEGESARSELWQRTRRSAAESDAPPAVRQTVSEVLREIATTAKQLEQRRDAVLTLQQRVGDVTATVEETLDRIQRERLESVNALLEPDRAPIWGETVMANAERDLREGVRDQSRQQVDALRAFAERRAGRFRVHLLLLIALVLLFRVARTRVSELAREQAGLDDAHAIFAFPYAMSVLVAILLGVWLYPQAPHVVQVAIWTLALLPAVRMLRHLAPPAVLPLVNAAVAFFLVDRLRELLSPLPVLERLIFLAQLVAAIALIFWLLRPSRLARIPEGHPRERLLRNVGVALRLVGAGFVVALVAEILGYSSLAQLLAAGLFLAGYGAAVFYTAVRIACGVVALLLRIPPLSSLRMVRRNRRLLEQRATSVVTAVGALLWTAQVLEALALRLPLIGGARQILSYELTVGSVHLSFGDVVAFALAIFTAFLVSRFLRFILEEDIYPRLGLERGLPYALSTLLHYALVTLGFVFAIAAAGLELDRLALVLGALGVGVGLGLQNVVNNFVSGLLLLFERPIQIGDTVQVGDLWGEVRHIGIRASIIRTWDGAEVIVPNGDLISNRVVNWTLSDRHRRIEVTVGVAYGSDPDRVLEILQDVTETCADVLGDPPPLITFDAFGDSALEFVVRAWIARFERGIEVKSRLGVEINRALREAGIEIPFPQRDLHVRSVDSDAARALRGDDATHG